MAKKEATTPAELGPVTRSELVRILRVAPTTVDAWKRAGCPCDTSVRPALYLVPDVIEWRQKRAVDEAVAAALEEAQAAGALGPAPDDPVSLDAYRKRRARAETELVELQLEEARSLVVPIDVVLEVVTTAVDNARTRIQAFPGRYSARLARVKTASSAKKLLQSAVREVLNELSSGAALTDRARAKSKGSKLVRGAARAKS